MNDRKTRVEECWMLAPKDFAAADVGALPSDDSLKIAFRAKHRTHFATPVTLAYRCRRIDGEDGSEFVLQRFVAYPSGRTSPQVQIVGIAETKPHLGGTRTWFVCECGQRVAKLYLPHDDEARQSAKFACRNCLHLSYRSAQEAHAYERRERRFARVLASCRRLDVLKRDSDEPDYQRALRALRI